MSWQKYGGKTSISSSFSCLCNKALAQYANRRISTDLSRRGFVAGMAASMLSVILPDLARGQTTNPPAAPDRPVTFTNFMLFDGKSSTLRHGLYLSVDGNRIGHIGSGQPPSTGNPMLIDCGGRVMIPGLIDMHWHSLLAALPIQVLLQVDMGFVYLAASAEAQRTLLRGFTTVRDAGGPAFVLRQAIDGGMVSGPRIYVSGPMITTTGGHGDFRPLADIPRSGGQISQMERDGSIAIADTEDEVRLRVREQFLQGASQVKLVGCGGVSTPRSPLDMLTFTQPQLRAAVETASDWGSYVLVHAYTPEAIQRSISAGVQCIEHGHLMDDKTAAIMAKNGTWLSTQPFVDENDAASLTGPAREKFMEVIAGTDNMYKLARKHGIKTAFGTDLIFSPVLAARQGVMLTHMTRWYSPAEALTMATAANGRLLALTGERNPYPGKLGVIEEGGYADLLLVDGNPLENLDVIADPEKNLRIVMKDGRLYKNTIVA
ncbi:metal-dependent hydrolase family protein [Paraburkholderia rhizosphaerae]|uniref:Imidazolonepropionase-like amidohydrolase n=1 Tax=Paraburkholderia rhizosphaerae TaxID=480658 RepID=A0A4R8M3J8_9BURK|nr:amidohydrolase family protein [Paraburkholderia rhizosphaerae]TDY54124.1 imidazolonepropionase-like amidohydrolase [Paraburkholderia rhizosphaerae]